MYFANPWGLLGLLALPVITAIHLYHRRFPPLPIAGLHLWTQEMRKESPGRKRERLPLTRTLLLELLAALLMTLLLADPRDPAGSRQTHLVVILDDSASMAATASGKSSRDRAVRWINEQAETLGRESVVSILTSGARPTLIAGPRADWNEVRQSLSDWNPRATSHSFSQSWDLASQLAGDEARLVFLTDRLPDDEIAMPQRMEAISFGRSLSNVAITAARWLYDAETGEGTLFVRLVNPGKEETDVPMRATSGQRSLIDETTTLQPRSEKSLQWTVPGGLGMIQFTAEAKDDPLAIDHQVTLIEPKVRMVTVSVLLPSDHSAFEPVKRILGVLPRAQLGDPGDADLVIAPAADEPIDDRSLWWLGIGPINPPQASENARAVIGPYLIEKQNPLMDGIVLGGVVWGGIQPAPDSLLPIISVGSTSLLGQNTTSLSTAYLLNIDLGASNLTESPDWPILWTNLIEQCRSSRPGFRRWNFRLGESIPFTLSPQSIASEDPLLLTHDNDEKTLLRIEQIEIPPRSDVGVYTVKDGAETLDQFAVNFFDREESDLSRLSQGERPAAVPAPAIGIHYENPFSWLIVVGLLAILGMILWDWSITRSRRLRG